MVFVFLILILLVHRYNFVNMQYVIATRRNLERLR